MHCMMKVSMDINGYQCRSMVLWLFSRKRSTTNRISFYVPNLWGPEGSKIIQNPESQSSCGIPMALYHPESLHVCFFFVGGGVEGWTKDDFFVRMNELGISSCIFLWNSQPGLHQSLLNFSPSIFQSILATFLSLLSDWCHSWWVCLIQKWHENAWKCIFSDCPTSFFFIFDFVTQSATHPVAVTCIPFCCLGSHLKRHLIQPQFGSRNHHRALPLAEKKTHYMRYRSIHTLHTQDTHTCSTLTFAFAWSYLFVFHVL